MTLDAVSFEGHPCVRLSDDPWSIFVTTAVGPRILGLVGPTGNLFAVLPDALVPGPAGDPYRLRGGHRLWAAPEVPEITYQPDDRPCVVTEVAGGVRVEAPADGAGLVKALEVHRTPGGWVIDHRLGNHGTSAITVAPWAVTQLRPGGLVVLPTGARTADEAALQANRCLVLWPYTDPGDPRVRLERDRVLIAAQPGRSPLKFGAAPSEGRAAYHVEGTSFSKTVSIDLTRAYPDRGAAVQVYVSDAFCELETLGPLRILDPGGSVAHREEWRLDEAPREPQAARSLPEGPAR